VSYIKLHKYTKLTPFQRQEIRRLYCNWVKVHHLANQFNVSRLTIYKVIKRARNNDFTIHKSINHRYRTIYYGFIRLAKIEHSILEKKNKEAHRYNKSYPREMIHIDTKLLPHIKDSNKREYLLVKENIYLLLSMIIRENYIVKSIQIKLFILLLCFLNKLLKNLLIR